MCKSQKHDVEWLEQIIKNILLWYYLYICLFKTHETILYRAYACIHMLGQVRKPDLKGHAPNSG